MDRNRAETRPPLPPIPSLPADLDEIASNLAIKKRGANEVADQIDHHVEKLVKYVGLLYEHVRDTLAAKENKQYLSGLGRKLQEEYSRSGLRLRIYDLLYVCTRFELPPRDTLVDLLRSLDGYDQKPRPPQWFEAIRRWRTGTEGLKPGRRPLSPTGLAKELKKPPSTIRGWMKRPEWKSDLEEDRVGSEKGYPVYYYGPIKK
jgi:hypothetical protein